MKKIKYLLVMIFTVMVCVSCDNADDEETLADPALVGEWVYTEVDLTDFFSLTLTFESDLKGSLVQVEFEGGQETTEIVSFTYSINGNQLTLVGGGETEVSTYSISDNSLTIDAFDDGMIFTKQ